MARGAISTNIKSIYKVGTIDIQKFVSSFTGGNGYNINDGIEYIELPAIPGIDEKVHNIITVKGDSMSPLIEDGDMLIVNTSKIKPKKGDIVAVVLNDNLMVKLFDPGAVCLHLTSINQDYEPIRVYEEDTCIIVGIVWKVIKDV
ncbi:MAG: helix-turn-helix transcriptional regulator [Candidatus Kapabacteria bacterium]|nr:helix-turn-helix transcriptional regulator [Ignavibacteriota bacterium]MCW5886469.1 helix-turn-helix transcriptional regulator [Candidatus Kapabacteria bacterium]